MTNTHARKAALSHIAGLVFNRPLAVSAERATTVLGVIGARLLEGVAVDEPKLNARTVDRRAALEDVEITAEGIAIIPVMGTFVKRATMMDAMSGLTSYERVTAMVSAAADSPQVRALLLQFDTPGGEVHGLFEAAAAIRAARDKKTVWGIADEMAYSAGYAMLSACERIFGTITAGTGSIGVIACRLDETEANDAAGVKWTIVTAGARKADGCPDVPTSAEEIDALSAKVQQVNTLFVELVAANRGMGAETILGLQAATYLGQAGIDVGLVDQLGTVDDALTALAAHLDGAAAAAASAQVGVTQPEDDETGEVIDLAAAREEGAMRARKEEKARAAGIRERCATAGEAALAGDFIADGCALADVEARLAVVAGIRDACAAAQLPELAASMITRGLSVEQAAAEILAKRAADDHASIIHSHLSPGATLAADASISVRDVYRDYRARTQGKGA